MSFSRKLFMLLKWFLGLYEFPSPEGCAGCRYFDPPVKIAGYKNWGALCLHPHADCEMQKCAEVGYGCVSKIFFPEDFLKEKELAE